MEEEKDKLTAKDIASLISIVLTGLALYWLLA